MYFQLISGPIIWQEGVQQKLNSSYHSKVLLSMVWVQLYNNMGEIMKGFHVIIQMRKKATKTVDNTIQIDTKCHVSFLGMGPQLLF